MIRKEIFRTGRDRGSDCGVRSGDSSPANPKGPQRGGQANRDWPRKIRGFPAEAYPQPYWRPDVPHLRPKRGPARDKRKWKWPRLPCRWPPIEKRNFGNCASPYRNSGLSPQRAALAAITEVNHKTDGQPNEETDPVHNRQSGHQQQAGENRQYRSERPAGRTEGAVPVGLAVTKNEHAAGNQGKGEERPNV